MIQGNPTTILFTGYAPVHFICFRPLYERLVRLGGFRVFLSGGLRTRTDSGYLYDERAMYRPFGLPTEQILSVAQIKEREFDVMFAANTKLIAPKGVARRVQLFHGISFRNRAIREDNKSRDAYFLVGPYMHRKFVEAGLLGDQDPRAVEIGFPKTDGLVNGRLNREELMRKYRCGGARTIILYAPTGARHNSLEIMGEDVIARLAETGRYDLLIKPHDHPKDTSIDWFAKLAALENAHTHVVRDLDVVPLLLVADLLVTDASSVSSEFSLLDRPMVFLDVPKLIAKAVNKDGSMTDTDTWGRRVGVVVNRSEDIVEVVRNSLENPLRHSSIRRAMAEDLFFNPGTATDVAVDWVCHNLAPRVLHNAGASSRRP